MRLNNTAHFDIHYCDERGSIVGRQDGLSHEEAAEWKAEANHRWTESNREDVELMRHFAVSKPDWFVSAERSARRFITGLGLQACKGTPVTLLDVEDPAEVKKIFPYDDANTSTDAQTSYYYGIIARYDRAKAAYEQKGKVALGHRIAHELTHAAEWQSPTVLNIFDSNSQEWHQANRQGHMLHLDDTILGQFFSEGVAEFNAGLYTRRQMDRDCPFVSIGESPTLQLPGHFVDWRPDKGVPYVVGPDGYSMELLAWGLQKRGITTAEGFISTAYATYSSDPQTRLRGLRTFASNVNALKRGLYVDLRNLEYGHQAWQEGLEMVYDAVTS